MFPRVIAELIVQYVGDWSLNLSIVNPECKQVSQSLISDNSKFVLISYTGPFQIILVNLHKKKSKRICIDNIIRVTLVGISDTGEFNTVIYYENYDVSVVKYNSKCKEISRIQLSRLVIVNYYTNSYIIYGRNIQFINDPVNKKGSLTVPSMFPIVACNETYFVFRGSEGDGNLYIYSLATSQRIAKIGGFAKKLPRHIALFDKYLITISECNELKLYDSSIKFAHILTEVIPISIPITILKMIDTQIIFGNPTNGLYLMRLDNIKEIDKLPINNLFTGVVINNQSIITIGPGANVTGYGIAKNQKLFRKLTRDKSDEQVTTMLV